MNHMQFFGKGYGRTYGQNDGCTDEWTDPLLELLVAAKKRGTLHKLTKCNRISSNCQPHQTFPNYTPLNAAYPNLTMKPWYLPDIFTKILLYHIN